MGCYINYEILYFGLGLSATRSAASSARTSLSKPLIFQAFRAGILGISLPHGAEGASLRKLVMPASNGAG
jgi:hypothetical protein